MNLSDVTSMVWALAKLNTPPVNSLRDASQSGCRARGTQHEFVGRDKHDAGACEAQHGLCGTRNLSGSV
jgi:hypothetical protein